MSQCRVKWPHVYDSRTDMRGIKLQEKNLGPFWCFWHHAGHWDTCELLQNSSILDTWAALRQCPTRSLGLGLVSEATWSKLHLLWNMIGTVHGPKGQVHSFLLTGRVLGWHKSGKDAISKRLRESRTYDCEPWASSEANPPELHLPSTAASLGQHASSYNYWAT